jgi:ribosome-associated heat shock protein Hsp15|tara:strand:+ start:72 stop:446 length:375 start_codon:yes stop_codon:yes gene_type:complete
METIRIDSWLWAVRLFKTRTKASEACKGGKVKIGGQNAKASRDVRVDDIIELQLHGIKRKVQVIKIVKNRVSAKLVPELLKDLTSPEEYEKQEMIKLLNKEKRDRGTGRPTKKERRIISKLKDY